MRPTSKSALAISPTDHNVKQTSSMTARAELICAVRIELEGMTDFLINDPTSRQLYPGARPRS
jgi:lipopolysaccharide export system ATP-binding protein